MIARVLLADDDEMVRRAIGNCLVGHLDRGYKQRFGTGVCCFVLSGAA